MKFKSMIHCRRPFRHTLHTISPHRFILFGTQAWLVLCHSFTPGLGRWKNVSAMTAAVWFLIIASCKRNDQHTAELLWHRICACLTLGFAFEAERTNHHLLEDNHEKSTLAGNVINPSTRGRLFCV